jgi:DNA-binding response OmpR family regulator
VSATVLLVEDAADIRLAVRTVLRRAGMRVVETPDGRSGLRALFDDRPDMVILDIGLPDMDGWEVLERVRDVSDVPVLILTARGLETDKVRGLRSGADDYLTKPYGNQELLARVEALLRRSGEQEPAAAELFDDGFLSIDHAGQRASVRGHPLELTPTEMRLLVALATRPGMVLGANQLLEAAWGDSTGTGSDRVKYAVLRLRRKLAEADGDEAAGALETLRGFGYRYQRPMT